MNQKGVTIAALVVTIIVVMILGAVSFTVGFQLMDYSRVRNSITILNLTRAEVEKIFEEFETEATLDYEGMTSLSAIMPDEAFKYLTLENKGVTSSMIHYTGDGRDDEEDAEVNLDLIIAKINHDAKEPMSSDEMQMLIDENTKVIDGTTNAPQQFLWFKWNTDVLNILKLDYQKLLTDSSKTYIYINYYTGEVILPAGVKSDTGKTYYSLSGLENAEWIETNV